MHLIPCLSGSCVLHVPGRQVERCVANFEKFRRLRRLWQIFLSISRNSETPQPWKIQAECISGALRVTTRRLHHHGPRESKGSAHTLTLAHPRGTCNRTSSLNYRNQV
jgi:hypothetical protein